MAQIKVTLAQMRTYMRGLDERLIDKTKYPDTWIDGKINTAYEVIATRRQPFLNEEALDLNPYISDGTEKFTVDMQYDVLGYKRIFYNGVDDLIPELEVTWIVAPDHTVEITMNTKQMNADNTNILTFQYWYIPTAPESETYMSSDIYHMLRHGMEFAAYESLRDMEKFQWAEQKIEQSATTVTNGLDIDIQPYDQWTGGFIV